MLAMPVSSSSVMNTTPLALPGRCRTSTTPAQRTRFLSLAWQTRSQASDALPGEHRPQKFHRMALQRQPDGLVIGDHLLRQRHLGQRSARSRRAARARWRLRTAAAARRRAAAAPPTARRGGRARSSGTHRHPPAGSARVLASAVSRAKSSSEVKGRRARAATMRSAQSSDFTPSSFRGARSVNPEFIDEISGFVR